MTGKKLWLETEPIFIRNRIAKLLVAKIATTIGDWENILSIIEAKMARKENKDMIDILQIEKKKVETTISTY